MFCSGPLGTKHAVPEKLRLAILEAVLLLKRTDLDMYVFRSRMSTVRMTQVFSSGNDMSILLFPGLAQQAYVVSRGQDQGDGGAESGGGSRVRIRARVRDQKVNREDRQLQDEDMM